MGCCRIKITSETALISAFGTSVSRLDAGRVLCRSLPRRFVHLCLHRQVRKECSNCRPARRKLDMFGRPQSGVWRGRRSRSGYRPGPQVTERPNGIDNSSRSRRTRICSLSGSTAVSAAWLGGDRTACGFEVLSAEGVPARGVARRVSPRSSTAQSGSVPPTKRPATPTSAVTIAMWDALARSVFQARRVLLGRVMGFFVFG